MRALVARRLATWAWEGFRRGDARRALRLFAPGARFRFAGSHSWAADTTDDAERRAWFERFAALRPELFVRDVLVAGPPWRMRACIVFDDCIRDDSGRVVYENHGVQYTILRWGRIVYDEANLDTQRVAGLDQRLPAAGDSPLFGFGTAAPSPTRSPF